MRIIHFSIRVSCGPPLECEYEHPRHHPFIRSLLTTTTQHADVVFPQLLREGARWGVRHELVSRRALWKRNDLANARRTTERADEPIETERDAAVRRTSVGQRSQQMIKRAELDVRQLEHVPQDRLLHRRGVHTNRTARDLHAVHD